MGSAHLEDLFGQGFGEVNHPFIPFLFLFLTYRRRTATAKDAGEIIVTTIVRITRKDINILKRGEHFLI